jgi:membrane-associated phospholipid phosphatase
MRRWPVGLAVWLLILASGELVCLLMTWRLFVASRAGQLLDTLALAGNSIGQAQTRDVVDTVLNTISVLSLAIATIVVGFIALMRRRFALAVGAVLLIAGSNVTTQLLKHGLARPDLGVDEQRLDNSLPSGHTTVVASVAAALVLVLPPAQRGAGAIIGSGLAALAGIATLSAGWHRPSDAVAALLVVGVWANLAGLFILAAQPGYPNAGDATRTGAGTGPPSNERYGPTNQFAVIALSVGAILLLAGATVAAIRTGHVLNVPPVELGRHRLVVAYAGGAMGVAGASAAVLAAVLTTAYRVVPAVVSSAPAQPD